MSDKVFAAFDDRKGPVPVYTTLSNKDLASKIAIKSIVSTLSARESQEKVEGEAIIPFPEENLLAFIYYASLDQKTETGDYRTISLSLLIPNEQSSQLYTNAGLLSQSAKSICEAINQHYIYGEPVSQYLQARINHWDKIEEDVSSNKIESEKKEASRKRKINLFDLYNLFPPNTGFRKYEDPISYIILAFLQNVPVVLSGPDSSLLSDFTELLQQIFPIKQLSIIKHEEIEAKINFNSSEPQNIPRADIVVLTDQLYEKCFFERAPIVILTTYQELKLPYHKFDEIDTLIISNWLKTSRESTDMKIIKDNLTFTHEKLNQLKHLAKHYGDSTIKEVCQSLKLGKEELEFCARILLNGAEVTAKELNILFHVDMYIQKEVYTKKESIGMINL